MELLNSTFSSALERSLTAVGGSSEHALTKEELRRSCALHCVAAAGGGEAVRIALADPICNFILVDKLMSVDERGAPRGNGERVSPRLSLDPPLEWTSRERSAAQ
jgi:hypothetical protein